MSLLNPSAAGSPVGLWFLDGVPVRLVHGGRRYRVIQDRLIVEGDDDRWRFTARDETGRLSYFEVRSAGLGWELVRAS
jgi:hypothetical protein